MKLIKIFGMIGLLGIFLMSCETNVEDPAGFRGVASAPGIKNLNPATFADNDKENTYVQFDVVTDDPAVDEAVIVVSYKGDKRRAEVTKASSFPATIKVSLTEAASALGISLDSIKAADVFNFEVQTIQGGKTYYSSAAFNVAVVCGYDVEAVSGKYRVISNDWGVDADITITADEDDPYVVYVSGLAAADGANEDLGPLKMVINPLDFSVRAPKTVLASNFFQYHNVAYEGSGQLNTCDGKYSMFFGITVAEGSFGSFNFEFVKK